jgi:hypothetical protein
MPSAELWPGCWRCPSSFRNADQATSTPYDNYTSHLTQTVEPTSFRRQTLSQHTSIGVENRTVKVLKF